MTGLNWKLMESIVSAEAKWRRLRQMCGFLRAQLAAVVGSEREEAVGIAVAVGIVVEQRELGGAAVEDSSRGPLLR